MDSKLQTRREFFKSAAKATLPVLGAVLLSQVAVAPALAATQCDGCSGACVSTCEGRCMGACEGTCTGSCTGSCSRTCYSLAAEG
jgi:CXXX repeat radical SAM target protein